MYLSWWLFAPIKTSYFLPLTAYKLGLKEWNNFIVQILINVRKNKRIKKRKKLSDPS